MAPKIVGPNVILKTGPPSIPKYGFLTLGAFQKALKPRKSAEETSSIPKKVVSSRERKQSYPMSKKLILCFVWNMSNGCNNDGLFPGGFSKKILDYHLWWGKSKGPVLSMVYNTPRIWGGGVEGGDGGLSTGDYIRVIRLGIIGTLGTLIPKLF